MGIPHLFRYLSLTYPHAVHVVQSQRAIPRCDVLCIDFNGIVHECARDLLLSHKARDDHSVTAASIDRLNHMVSRLRPQQCVFVAVDGVPPRAKMSQQRSRRYMSMWRRTAFPDAFPSDSWDTNAITPGTAFMDVLGAALAAWAASYPCTAGPKIHVSDASEKGEGEQKIFAALRSNQVYSGSTYLCGLDADLILMALRSPARDRLNIVREQNGALQFIDIKKLASGVAKDMAQPALDNDEGDVVCARLRDFAALCALLGNDFVPAMPGLRIRDGAVRFLVGAYKRAREGAPPGTRLSSHNGPDVLGGLNVILLATILRDVALHEGGLLAAADKRYHDRVRWAATAPAALLADPEEVYPALNPPVFGVDAVRPGEGSAWRLRYYHHVFNGADSASSVRSVCLSYLCGLAWTLSYLGDQRSLSDGWWYPCGGHAPTAHDMCHLLMDDGLAREVEGVMEATDRAHRNAAIVGGPLWHLVLVLPPASVDLIRDPELRALMTRDPRSAHAFPIDFRIDTYLKDRLWECHPVLPPFCSPPPLL